MIGSEHNEQQANNNEGIVMGHADAALQRMRDRAEKAGFGAFDWEVFKEDRDSSRP